MTSANVMKLHNQSLIVRPSRNQPPQPIFIHRLLLAGILIQLVVGFHCFPIARKRYPLPVQPKRSAVS